MQEAKDLNELQIAHSKGSIEAITSEVVRKLYLELSEKFKVKKKCQ